MATRTPIPPRPAPGADPAVRLRPLQLMWARGFRFLFVLDAVALVAVMVATNLVRFGTPSDWPTYGLTHYLVGFAVVAALHLTVGYFAGLYVREPRLGYRAWLPRIVAVDLMAVLLAAGVFLAVGRQLMPRWNLVVLFVVGSLLLAANRRLSRFLARRRQGPPRVLLVGPPDDVDAARDHLRESDRAAVVVGSVPDGVDLLVSVRALDADEVLLMSSRSLADLYPEPLITLERDGVGVLQRVGAQETLLGLQSVREVGGMPFVKLRAHALPTHKAKLKRTLELVGVVALLPVLVPVLAAVALYVRAVAGRGVLFRQDRVGRDGRIFRMVKFRTMVPAAEEGLGAVLSRRGDPRVIGACQWLRDSRLDELPQVWNVLRGEMSVVGPRPERPELTARFAELIPGYGRRHELPPGLTGLAQVAGRYDTDPGFKLGHDLQYLVNWSPVLDLQILAKTFWVVISRRV